MDKIKYHIPWLIGGILFGIIVVGALTYLLGIGDKIDKIYSSLDHPVSCGSLPYGIENSINTMANTLSVDTSCNDK